MSPSTEEGKAVERREHEWEENTICRGRATGPRR